MKKSQRDHLFAVYAGSKILEAQGARAKAKLTKKVKPRSFAVAGGSGGAVELLKPLADAALLTCVRGYNLGPDRYREAMALMDAGSAALAAATKAKQLLQPNKD